MKFLQSSKEYIKIYSAQDVKDLERCKNLGYLTGQNPENYMDETDKTVFNIPYNWIYKKMSERKENFSGDWPIWAWPQKWNLYQYKKYMRSLSDKTIFKKTVLVYAEVPISRILISDYDMWHMPLNKSPVTWTEKEYDSYYPDKGKIPPLEERMKTWDRIFDIKWPETIEIEWTGNPNKRSFQLCVDRIYFNEITKIRTIDNKKDIKKTFF